MELVEESTVHDGLGAVLDVVMSVLIEDLLLTVRNDEDDDFVLTKTLEEDILVVVKDEVEDVEDNITVINWEDIVLTVSFEAIVLTAAKDE